jgi:hypothetical protein
MEGVWAWEFTPTLRKNEWFVNEGWARESVEEEVKAQLWRGKKGAVILRGRSDIGSWWFLDVGLRLIHRPFEAQGKLKSVLLVPPCFL